MSRHIRFEWAWREHGWCVAYQQPGQLEAREGTVTLMKVVGDRVVYASVENGVLDEAFDDYSPVPLSLMSEFSRVLGGAA